MSIFQLAREGDVDALLRLLDDSRNPDIRARAAETLAEFDDRDEAGSPVTDGLIAAARTDEDRRVRAAAIDALDGFGALAIERLLREMAGRDAEDDGEGMPDTALLVRMLDAELPELRMVAANAIGHAEDETAIGPLAERLSDDHPRVRARVARALGRIGDAGAAQKLADATSDPHPRVRREAVEALGDLGGPEAKRALIGRLDDGSDEVRRSAVASLGSFDDPALLGPLLDVLDDEVDLIQQAAVHSTIDLLARVPDERSEEMRETIVDAFSSTSDEMVVDPLLDILAESSLPEHRRDAARLLGRLGGDPPAETVIEALCDALADDDPRVSRCAMSALTAVGGRRVETHVLSVLDGDDLDPVTRMNAVFTLGTVGGTRARKRIEALLRTEESDEVTEHATAVLSQLDGDQNGGCRSP